MNEVKWYHHVWFLFVVVVLSAVVSVAIAGNVGVAYNDDTNRVTYQDLRMGDGYKFYINADINNPDTDRVSTVTRVLGHAGSEDVHVSVMGTFTTGYNAMMVGVGMDLLKDQLLGFDVGRRNNGDTAIFGYWGVGNALGSSDGFVDSGGKTYITRGNLLYKVNRRIQAGYEVEVKNDIPLHSLRMKVSL